MWKYNNKKANKSVLLSPWLCAQVGQSFERAFPGDLYNPKQVQFDIHKICGDAWSVSLCRETAATVGDVSFFVSAMFALTLACLACSLPVAVLDEGPAETASDTHTPRY